MDRCQNPGTMVKPQIAGKWIFIMIFIMICQYISEAFDPSPISNPLDPPTYPNSVSGLAARSGFDFKGWSTVKGTFLRLGSTEIH